jgi:hypothetical protein
MYHAFEEWGYHRVIISPDASPVKSPGGSVDHAFHSKVLAYDTRVVLFLVRMAEANRVSLASCRSPRVASGCARRAIVLCFLVGWPRPASPSSRSRPARCALDQYRSAVGAAAAYVMLCLWASILLLPSRVVGWCVRLCARGACALLRGALRRFRPTLTPNHPRATADVSKGGMRRRAGGGHRRRRSGTRTDGAAERRIIFRADRCGLWGLAVSVVSSVEASRAIT